MEITIAAHPGGCHVRFAGELTIGTVAAVRARLAPAVLGHAETEIDLGGVEDVDSAGLQLLLMAKRCAGRTVRLVNHSEAVLRLLELSNLGHALGDPLLIAARTRS